MSSVSSFDDISSSDISMSEDEVDHQLPRKKRYRRALYSGLNKRQEKYYTNICNEIEEEPVNNTSPESPCDLPYSDTPSLSEISQLSDTGSSDIFDSTSCTSEFSITSGDESLDDEDSCDDDNSLYDGCNHTFFSSYMMVMLFVQKNSLTKEAFTDLLRLVSTHLPSNTKYSKSVYKVKDFLKKYVQLKEATEHKYCDHCCQILPPNVDSCPSVKCRQGRAKVLEFHDLHLDQQLRDLFQDEKFVTLVTSKKPTHSEAAEVISDITDGSEYKRLQQNETANAVNLTFTMNTDGVALFKSSKNSGSLWPIYVAINEIPLPQRFSKKYILATHLYNQKQKPNMLTYMAPLMSTMETLSGKGIEVVTPRGKLLIKGKLLATTVDLPAKAMVANSKQFNGKFGCSVCLDEGAGRPNCPQHRYWPFNPVSMPRTHESWIADANEAVTSQSVVRGIKGASPLVALKYIDLPKVFVIDWMHCVLLGVSKTLMKLWFSGDFRNEPFSIADKVSFLNRRLRSIQIPDFIRREQRDLVEHAHWKASECREWLLHYSIPILEGVLPATTHIHYSLLVTAMYLLNKEQVTEADIEFSEELLLDFCKLFPDLYGEYHQTMNVHLLKHLPSFVRLHGPLFATSCFGFESMNSHIKKMIHGTRFVNKQVGFAVAITKSLPQLMNQWTAHEGVVHPDIQSLAQHLSTKFMCEVERVERLDALGKKVLFLPTNEQCCFMSPVLDNYNVRNTGLFKYLRLRCGRQVYYSKQYSRVKNRNSYMVATNDGRFGEIHFYICAGDVHFAVLQLCNVLRDPVVPVPGNADYELHRKYGNAVLCPHVKKISFTENFILMHTSNLGKKCVTIKFGENVFVSEPPNLLEHN